MSKEQEKKLLIATRLRTAREQAGLSQGQVAKKRKMHRPTISEIEAGRRNVTAEEISEFAKLYDVDVAWLSGADSKEDQDPKLARYQLAARKLSQMKPKDFDKLMSLLDTLRRDDDSYKNNE